MKFLFGSGRQEARLTWSLVDVDDGVEQVRLAVLAVEFLVRAKRAGEGRRGGGGKQVRRGGEVIGRGWRRKSKSASSYNQWLNCYP